LTTTQTWTEELVNVAGGQAQLLKGGSGPPVFVLHDEIENPGWQPYHEALSRDFTVYAPSHPGYDKSTGLQWVRRITDVAHFYQGLRLVLGLEAPVSLVGISMGGWLAAEMAAMCPASVRGLVLVGAMGIKPEVGEIAEVLMVGHERTLGQSFHDSRFIPDLEKLTPEEAAVRWSNREVTSRLCWKPYMHNPSLPHLLEGVQGLPTLIIWGRDDRIIPLSAGQTYNRAISGSELLVFDNCGHRPEIEKTSVFFNSVRNFLAQQ
jgi:pimeloyl-ACP methyl ester carboxylesterase